METEEEREEREKEEVYTNTSMATTRECSQNISWFWG